MTPRHVFLAMFVALLLAPVAMADSSSPNTTTPAGPGFNLDTSVTGGTPGFLEPCIFVGLDGDGSVRPALDLTNASTPVLSQPPEPDAPPNYSLFVGMINPASPSDQFTYMVGMPDRNGNFTVTVMETDAGGRTVATYTESFQLNTGGAGISGWTMSTPRDSTNGSQGFQVDFSLSPPPNNDPALTFSLTETVGGTTDPLTFFPEETVPEPGTMGMLGAGLAMLAALRKHL